MVIEEANTLLEEGYDSDQVSMMSEQVILVDESDNPLGPMSKVESHRGEGVLHRAFSILLFDENDRLLLQKRASHKITFPSVWANTVCSHPLHIDGELNANGPLGDGSKVAAVRKMEQELGIAAGDVPLDDIFFITRMLYRARADEIWVEHELDHILFARTTSDLLVEPNPNEISETAWVTQTELQEWLEDPKETRGIIAPWFRLIAENILPEWWGNLDGLPTHADHLIRDMGEVKMSKNRQSPDDSKLGVLTALKSHKDAVETRIIAALSKSENDILGSAMMHLIAGGGKRMRAILPWLVADAVGNSNDGLYDLGASIEIIHNFTLVHDDIMDDDDVRRGRPAVHVEYDLPTAINAGDAMLAIAFEAMAVAEGIEPELLPFLVKRIGRMVRKCSEGQQLDIEFEDRDVVSEDEYIEMIHGKTAAMFLTCAEVGSHLAGADEDIIQCMHDWGLALGLCFQLMDDLIDVLSDSDTLGKPSGSDVAQGKRTLMVIHALRQPASQAKDDLLAVLGKGDNVTAEQVARGHQALHDLGSIEYAKAIKQISEKITFDKVAVAFPGEYSFIFRDLISIKFILIWYY